MLSSQKYKPIFQLFLFWKFYTFVHMQVRDMLLYKLTRLITIHVNKFYNIKYD